MIIEFCAINKPEDWMEMVAEQFGTSVTDNGFTIPPSVGQRLFQAILPVAVAHIDLHQFYGIRTDDNGASLGGKLEMDSRDVLYQRA